MRYSTDLPNLQLLMTDHLVPHEDSDPRRVEKLSVRINQDGILKNPPVVSKIPNSDCYVILDGANRVAAFRLIGIPHIVAQVVSYADPGVILDSWNHVVAGLAENEFELMLSQVKNLVLKRCTLADARLALTTNIAAAYIICSSGVRMVVSAEGKLMNDIHLLNDIVGAYKGNADIFRASNDLWEKQVPFYPNITALVVFPQYTPADILMVTANGYRVPSGVTRHIIPNRALHINIPIEILKSPESFEKKINWLHDWLMERMASNALRYYNESTFSFDE